MNKNLQSIGQVPPQEMLLQWDFIQRMKELIQSYSKQKNRHLKCMVKTFGCQGNVADGEKISGMLREMDYIPTENPTEADLIVYNTCAIRENAEFKLLSSVGELKHIKKKNPNLIIALCGCMMQQEQITDKIKKSYPYVDLIFGTHVMHTLPELLYKVFTERKRVINIEDSKDQIAEGLPVSRDKGVCASIQIMYGCNNFCSYCIVPYVRGREVSRKPEAILEEVKQVISEGYKEILLLGQNVNSYGNAFPGDEKVTFSQILQQINDIDGDFIIRFMTPHPKDFTKELIDTISNCNKVCRAIHLPLQSGSNRILKEMNRRYTKEQYLDLVDYAKEKIPDVAFSTDIIVGFPGETYDEFKETLDVISKVRYNLLYTFIYSSRPGTKAATMDDPISAKEKSQWMGELLEKIHQISDEENRKYVGKIITVLAEKTQKNPDDNNPMVVGRNTQGIWVGFDGDIELIGEFAPVRITKSHRSILIGEIVK